MRLTTLLLLPIVALAFTLAAGENKKTKKSPDQADKVEATTIKRTSRNKQKAAVKKELPRKP